MQLHTAVAAAAGHRCIDHVDHLLSIVVVQVDCSRVVEVGLRNVCVHPAADQSCAALGTEHHELQKKTHTATHRGLPSIHAAQHSVLRHFVFSVSVVYFPEARSNGMGSACTGGRKKRTVMQRQMCRLVPRSNQVNRASVVRN